jgi:hypothetical protein
MERLPYDVLIFIDHFYNPYKTYFTKTIISQINFKRNYESVLKQLLQYNLYDVSGNVISFQLTAILG